MDRRSFLAGCAACAARTTCMAAAANSFVAKIGRAQTVPAVPSSADKPRIRLVFSHYVPDKPTWPYEGFDYEGRKKEIAAKLSAGCPNIEFLPVTAMSAADARKILLEDSDVDGYVVYMIGLWTRAGDVIASSNRPTVFVDDLYAGSGEFLISYAAARRKGLRVAGVASSRWDDVVASMRAFEALKRLRSAVILDVVDRDPASQAGPITDVFGTSVRRIGSDEYNDWFRRADAEAGKQLARKWIKGAQKVIEPSSDEIDY
jgi:hypothetical protein